MKYLLAVSILLIMNYSCLKGPHLLTSESNEDMSIQDTIISSDHRKEADRLDRIHNPKYTIAQLDSILGLYGDTIINHNLPYAILTAQGEINKKAILHDLSLYAKKGISKYDTFIAKFYKAKLSDIERNRGILRYFRELPPSKEKLEILIESLVDIDDNCTNAELSHEYYPIYEPILTFNLGQIAHNLKEPKLSYYEYNFNDGTKRHEHLGRYFIDGYYSEDWYKLQSDKDKCEYYRLRVNYIHAQLRELLEKDALIPKSPKEYYRE